MTPEQARSFAQEHLKPIREIEDFERHIVGDPIVTRWTQDPYTGAAYSSAPPAVTRTGPRMEAGGRLIIAGDAFDTEFPATLAGAHLSGQEAGKMLGQALEREAIGAQPAAWRERTRQRQARRR